MTVEHERRQRAAEPRELALEINEATSRNLHGTLEIQHAERFAEGDVIFGRVHSGCTAEGACWNRLVLVFTRAIGYVRRGDVRDAGELALQHFGELAFLLFANLNLVFQARDFLEQR